MGPWFGSSWSTIAAVVLSTVTMYAATIAAVRIAGRRTVAELSAFDAVVTVALGSIVGSTIVSPSPTVLEGAAAVAALLSLQVLVAFVRRRSGRLRRILEFSPEVVMRDGDFVARTHPLGAQLTEEELRARLRQLGVHDVPAGTVVLLEPTGGISVIPAGGARGDVNGGEGSRTR